MSVLQEDFILKVKSLVAVVYNQLIFLKFFNKLVFGLRWILQVDFKNFARRLQKVAKIASGVQKVVKSLQEDCKKWQLSSDIFVFLGPINTTWHRQKPPL